MITLHLVRHADAVPAAAGDDDAARPLSSTGEAEALQLARALRLAGVHIDLVCTSPRRRAVQTAALLRRDGSPIVVAALAAGDPAATVAALARARSDPGVDTGQAAALAAVGHEPSLSELAAYLLTGDPLRVAIAFRTASLLTLEGSLRRGGMRLVAFMPVALARALLEARDGGAPG